jgi:hypothetical protein
MGRHTRKLEEGGPPRAVRAVRSRRSRWFGMVPLLPALALICAVAMVAAAISTKQVALNFGGNPSPIPSGTSKPLVPGQQSVSELSQRGSRTSRDATRSGFAVTFFEPSRTAHGFHGVLILTNHTKKAITHWTLSFRYAAARVLSATGATVVTKGTVLALRNAPASLAPGRSLMVKFTAQGKAGSVLGCMLDGKPCHLEPA